MDRNLDLSNGPLSGIRIVELTLMVVGPSCGLQLGHLGAEVIKIETGTRTPGTWGGVESRDTWNWSVLNGGKLGIAMNLKNPEGLPLLKRLLAESDVLFYNIRHHAALRMGLDPETLLREVNPNLIIMSMSMSGTTGPEKDYGGVATSFAARGGVSHLSGFPGQAPLEMVGWPDLEVGNWGIVALMSALVERERTGKGMFIDVSGNEGFTWYTGETLLDFTMNGRSAGRDGSWPPSVLTGCYPCRGDQRYISIAVGTDDEWRALCEAMDDLGMITDERFATALTRLANREAIDRCVAEWTVRHENVELAERLQAQGVAAIPAFTGEDLYALPHLQQREAFDTVPAPYGDLTLVGPAWHFSETHVALRSPGPLLGEDNAYVFGEILGLPADELDRLTKDGILA